MFVLIRQTVTRSFTKNLAVASGVARTGFSMGLFVMAPLTQLFLSTYGWRGTMLLVGGISLHASVCGALMVATDQAAQPHRRTLAYQRLPEDDSDALAAHQTSLRAGCGAFERSIFKTLDLNLLGNGRYWLVVAMYCSTCFPFDMWNIYFVSQSQSIGFSVEDAGTFITVGAVGNLIGKLSQGFITDRGVLSSWTMASLSTAVVSAAYCATPWVTSYWSVMATSFLILLGNGVQYAQNDVLTKELIEENLLAGAFGWIGLKSALLTFAFGFLPGKGLCCNESLQ